MFSVLNGNAQARINTHTHTHHLLICGHRNQLARVTQQLLWSVTML